MKLDYIHRGDCLRWLKTIPDQSVDIIWTDPPYDNNQNNGDLNASLKEKNGFKSTAKPILNDDPESWEPLIKGLIAEAGGFLNPPPASAAVAAEEEAKMSASPRWSSGSTARCASTRRSSGTRAASASAGATAAITNSSWSPIPGAGG